jgi:hypothetical protein
VKLELTLSTGKSRKCAWKPRKIANKKDPFRKLSHQKTIQKPT